jgi:hypothetical protein
MAGLLAEGTLYLNREVSGVASGWKQIPGLAEFTISNKSDIKEQISKDKGKYGQITASVAIPKPSELTVRITNFDRTSLAMALMGEDVDLTETLGTVTAEEVVAKPDVYVPLAKRYITAASVAVTEAVASTPALTFVENVDYRINYTLGMIEAVKGGLIAADKALHVAYGHKAIAGFTVSGATKPQIQGALKLDGTNLSDGKTLIINVDRALLVADGDVNFMDDKFVEIGFAGRMETLSGKTSPYTVESF